MQFIKRYEKVYSDEFCDRMIEYFDLAEKQGFIRNRQSHDGNLKTEKEDIAHFAPTLNFGLNNIQSDLWKEFNQVFWQKCYSPYANEFDILKDCSKHQLASNSAKIQKTKPGQGYHVWHSEFNSIINSTRMMAWSVYLNDNFEAGETEFLYQQYRYKPQKGDCLIWPAGYTHTHRGNPPYNGDKYIITGWLEYRD